MNHLQKTFCEKIGDNQQIAFELNRYLAENPEISGQEFKAVARITDILTQKGIPVEEKLAGIPTSFKAKIATGSSEAPRFGILMEYDALPEIGHACGHSASGSLSLLTALTLWEMKEQFDATVDLIGTPNEETKGDKITLGEAGVFDGYDFVMMIHMNSDQTFPACHFLALSDIRVTFSGKPAHAAASPWEGRNALNGALLACQAVDMLRQQLRPDNRIAYIVTNGGNASNVIPEKAELIINLRTQKKKELQETFAKVQNCIKGAALATGTTVKVERTGPDFDDMNLNQAGIMAIDQIMTELEIPHEFEPEGAGTGSSDIGNVSYLCPAFHPMMAISDHHFSLHTKEVADIMLTDEINQVIVNGAKVIGSMILKAIDEPALRQAINQEFAASLKELK